MRLTTRTYLAALLLILIPASLSAIEDRYWFNNFNTSNSGLAYDLVKDVVQDEDGYIWVGTYSGLSRYDGTRFVSYHKEDFGLVSEFICSMLIDDNGSLWIGTDRGMTVYDRQSDRFSPFDKVSDAGTTITNKVNGIEKDSEGNIWISVNNQGLFRYSPSDGSLHNLLFSDGAQSIPVNIRSFCISSLDEVWVVLYYMGLYRLDKETEQLIPVLDKNGNTVLRNEEGIKIVPKPGDESVLYVAANPSGLNVVNTNTGEVRRLSSAKTVPEHLLVTSDRQLWMSTFNGVHIYDLISGEQSVIAANALDPFSIPDGHICVTFEDRDGGIWVGTNVSGLCYSGKSQRNFEKCYIADRTPLLDCVVRDIAFDGKNTVYVATEKEGLLVYDTLTRRLRKKNISGLPKSLLTVCCCYDYLWVGSSWGLYKVDMQGRLVKSYGSMQQFEGVNDNKIFSIFRSSKDELYVGTTLGLHKYEPATDSFVTIPGFDGYFITGIDEDNKGNLWAGTFEDGILKYSMKENSVVAHYINNPVDPSSLPSNKVFSVLADGRGDIWAATFADGFCRLDKQSGKFEIFNRSTCPMLPTNNFFKIQDDESGNMWVSSAKGLVYYNCVTSDIRCYTVADGLLNNEFKNCGVKTYNGDIYMGSRGGFIRFNPKSFVNSGTKIEVSIAGMKIGDEQIKSSEDGPVKSNLNLVSDINLSPVQNSFGFSFAVPGCFTPAAATILCKLDGYDKEYRRMSSDNTMFWYNVPSGRYCLKIATLRDDGTMVPAHDDVFVNVAEKFYKTGWAIMLYVLTAVLILIGIYVAVYKSVRHKEKMKREAFRKRKEEELYHDKMSFFSNVIHEIKTPLTLIHTPLQNVMAKLPANDNVKSELQVIMNGTEYIDQLVKELLDFIRIEEHGYLLALKSVDLVECINFLCFNFKETAKARNLKVQFLHKEDHVFINADMQALNKILNNLIHNAVKYAYSYVDIVLEEMDGNAVIDIRNDGPAIPAERRAAIFKPFVQFSSDTQPYSQSFGIGLSLARKLTQMHSGSLVLTDDPSCTDFRLTLPLSLKMDDGQEKNIGETKSANAEGEDSSKPLILVVEDNADLLEYLKNQLSASYRVLTSPSAEVAVGLIRQWPVELVITDIALNAVSGVELCRIITTNFETSHIRVIVISAISSNDVKISCMENGASLYIEKPFSLDYLTASIKGIFERRKRLKQASSGLNMKEVDSGQFNLMSADGEFLKKLNTLISDNINNPSFTSKQLEEQLFLSRSTLIRKVRALLDTTPNDYIRARRLAAAAKLLTMESCRINEVCYAVGFNSPSWFARCFKERYGMLPSEYRAQNFPGGAGNQGAEHADGNVDSEAEDGMKECKSDND